MKVKRYLVKSMPEAMELIRRDLGSEAVILSSRKVRAGQWWNPFAPCRLEVTAAVDTPSPSLLEREKRLYEELGELRGLLKKLLPLVPKEEEKHFLFRKWRETLLELEVSEELATEILEELAAQASWEGVAEEIFREALVAQVAKILASKQAPPRRGKILGFVGPTGAGKTTTIAKLAARFSLFERRKVGLVTIDTYRIGAVEQLKTYAEILMLPMEVAMNPRELREAVKKLHACDVILLDTTGRPPQDAVHMQELRSFLGAVEGLSVYLVLSCTTRTRDLLRNLEDYRSLNYSHLVFTKLDETNARGVILEAVRRANQPVAYVTTGQNVPQDLEVAHPERLARLILGVENCA